MLASAASDWATPGMKLVGMPEGQTEFTRMFGASSIAFCQGKVTSCPSFRAKIRS